MKSATITALAALLSAGAQAAPSPGHAHLHAARHAQLHAKRDVYWVTEYEVETVTVMRTVYADGSSAGEQTVTGIAATSYASPAPSPAADTTSTTAIVVPAPATTSSVVAKNPVPAPAPSSSSSSSSQAPAPVQSSSTSVYVPPPAPQTSSSTTTTYQAPAPATTASSAAPASSSAASTYPGGNSYPTTAGATYSGDFTYYTPGLGACGITSSESDHIVAISEIVFDKYTPGGNPNANTLCGRYVTLYNPDGTTYQAKVVDRCVGCAAEDLDMTETLFNLATNNGNGRVHNMKWSWD